MTMKWLSSSCLVACRHLLFRPSPLGFRQVEHNAYAQHELQATIESCSKAITAHWWTQSWGWLRTNYTVLKCSHNAILKNQKAEKTTTACRHLHVDTNINVKNRTRRCAINLRGFSFAQHQKLKFRGQGDTHRARMKSKASSQTTDAVVATQ